MSYRLDDVEVLHHDSPRTYSIPRRDVREMVPVGGLAKLVFLLPEDAPEGHPSAERMWCLVKERRGDSYVGELTNQPRYLPGVTLGDEVEFEARHVAAISVEDEPSMAPLVGCALAVLYDGAWPCWVVRVAPTSQHDSGWRVFAEGGDTRVRAVSASGLFRAWAMLDSVIDGATIGAWRWDPMAVELVRAGALPPNVIAAAAEGLGRLHKGFRVGSTMAVATRRALEEPPRRASHFEPDREEDSGWCFFVGDESQEHLDDAANSQLVHVAHLVHRYPYIERVLGETGEMTWEWDESEGDWAPMDPQPSDGER